VYQGHLETVVFATRRKWNESKMLSINPNQIEENEENILLYLWAKEWDRLLEVRRKKASHKSTTLSYKSDLTLKWISLFLQQNSQVSAIFHSACLLVASLSTYWLEKCATFITNPSTFILADFFLCYVFMN
jgi:hypothetical protein